jgi:prepilin-type processing-associated H-X9-DG protein
MLDRPRADHDFVVTRSHGRPLIWTWEIHRRPEPLEVKLSDTDFKTESAAKLAGEKAPVAFLDGHAKEERNA